MNGSHAHSLVAREPLRTTWLRRTVSLPVYLVLAPAYLLLLPVTLLVVLAIDIARPRQFIGVRCALMGGVFFVAELMGIAGSVILWLSSGGWRRNPSEAYLARNFALQCRWGNLIFRGAVAIFGLRLVESGDGAATPGPIIVLGRHASPVDNLLPIAYVSVPHGIRLRWVINRWLLRDPSIDIVGNRLPNIFVQTQREDPGRQSDRVGRLASGMGIDEGLLIFPEGALFSTGRRERVIQRLEENEPATSGRASRLKHTLAPRTGGVLAALDAAPDADVVIMAHTGLEPAANYRAFLTGRIIGSTVHVGFWRIPRASIPAGVEGRTEWLWEQWFAIDRWIEERRAGAAEVAK